MTDEMTQGQIESWYHSKILRIPHGKQNPTKRYLTEKQILDVFSGDFVDIFEKVDGKLTSSMVYDYDGENNEDEVVRFFIIEDMTGKNTCHNHVMKYKNLPKDKKIYLDVVIINKYGDKHTWNYDVNNIQYCRINFNNNRKNLSLKEIYTLLEALSKMSSHFGSDKIEGLVIKNPNKQIMAKWINDEFEDKIKENKK